MNLGPLEATLFNYHPSKRFGQRINKHNDISINHASGKFTHVHSPGFDSRSGIPRTEVEDFPNETIMSAFEHSSPIGLSVPGLSPVHNKLLDSNPRIQLFHRLRKLLSSALDEPLG